MPAYSSMQGCWLRAPGFVVVGLGRKFNMYHVEVTILETETAVLLKQVATGQAPINSKP